jgi:putative ATP-binding cassette transporter
VAPLIAGSVLLGAIASIATVALLAAVNAALAAPQGIGWAAIGGFLLLCAASFAGNAAADILTNAAGQGLVAQLRRALAARIAAAPIDALERFRPHRLLPVLTGDVDALSDVAFLVAPLAISLAVSLGCLAFLVWLCAPLAFAAALLLGAGMAAVHAARLKGVAGFEAAREQEDRLHKSYRTLVEGAKELRLSRPRRERLLGVEIAQTVDRIRRINLRAINLFVVANAAGSSLYFLCVAAAIAGAPVLGVAEPAVLTGFVLTLLYMKGPVEQALQALPAMARGLIAPRRIEALVAAFGAVPAEEGAAAAVPVLRQGIEMSAVVYRFAADAGAAGFEIGPVDLVVRPGEMVFVCGANGSGKTTLIKLLLGLYAPQAGTIRIDGRAVDDAARDAYRQHFSAVLSDYFLFEDLPPGADAAGVPAHLDRLGLAGKLMVEGERLSSIDLSTGQRKRLALLNAYLERRPVVVFDEWAADQDPAFRRLFYEALLPEMKAQGRTLVVISHDDRYFAGADRLLRLADGRIVEEVRAAPQAIEAGAERR